MLELRALGNAEIVTDKATLTPSQEIVFAAGLYLVLERQRRVSRSALSELLWPAVEESVRGHRLRQTILQLKKFGFPVAADRNHMRLATLDFRTDVDDIQAGRTASNARESLEFLPGYSPRFSQPFRDWVDGKRSEVHAKCSLSLMAGLGSERAKADWAAVDKTARAILEVDPYNENAVLALAEATAMRGQKREAVAMLDRFLQEMGPLNTDIRLPATVLRKRILDAPPVPPAGRSIEAAFVGRAAEMETLTRTLRRVRAGEGGGCLIIGEPGIGKSRVAAELAKFAELQGVRTQTVRCQRANVDRPLSVLADFVLPLREMPGAIGCSQETLLALRRLTEFDTQGAELSVATGESRALQHTLRQALFDLLDALTDETSLLLILDDIQWIDKASADIVAGMIAWAKTKRLLFLLASRMDQAELLSTFRRTDVEVIELSALPNDSAEALLTSIVSERRSEKTCRLSRWILDAGEGNPFFLQELAKHWLEFGDTHDAPPSVSKVLRARLSRLDPVSLNVLQSCTILGQNSTVERVQQVLEYSSHQILGAIQELSEVGMLTSTERSPGIPALTLQSRHDLLSSAVIDSMAPAARAFLHRKSGMVLEKELSGQRMPTVLLWACAFHWHYAGERDRALSVARSCADHLLEVGLPNDAVEALDRALEYSNNDEQRILLLARQVEALQMAGKWERSKQVLRNCRQLRSRVTAGAEQHDDFEIMLFKAAFRTSLDVLDLLSEVRLCVECEDAAADHRIQAGAIALKLASDIDKPLMDSIYLQLTPLFTEAGISRAGRAEAEMIYHSTCGDTKKGLAAARELVQFARESRSPAALTGALTNAANSSRLNGSDRESETYLLEALAISAKHHLTERANFATNGLLRLHLSRGDLPSAREALRQGKDLPMSSETKPMNGDRHLLEARVALAEGNLAQARMAFSKVLDASEPDSPNRRASCISVEIRIRVLQKDPPEILRPIVSELENTHLKLRAMGIQDFETESLYLGLKALGEEERGQRLVNEYLQHHRHDRGSPAAGLAALKTP